MFICLSGWINRHLVSDTNGRKGEKSRNEYKEWGGGIETETDRQTDRQTDRATQDYWSPVDRKHFQGVSE